MNMTKIEGKHSGVKVGQTDHAMLCIIRRCDWMDYLGGLLSVTAEQQLTNHILRVELGDSTDLDCANSYTRPYFARSHFAFSTDHHVLKTEIEQLKWTLNFVFTFVIICFVFRSCWGKSDINQTGSSHFVKIDKTQNLNFQSTKDTNHLDIGL